MNNQENNSHEIEDSTSGLSIDKIQNYELKWIHKWESEKTYKLDENSSKPKFYCLVMFPYPSGRIHVGHVRNYAIGDAIARYKRLNGFNVLHPIGWDSFGLPAENAAIKNQIPPLDWTLSNIASMNTQLKRMGISYDWDRELATCKEEYYKWNQYFFLQMYKKGWVYKKEAPVNWCNECSTVLANEQVIDGCCWRHEKQPVIKKKLAQWFFKITDFSEELLEGHNLLEAGWPKRALLMQKNWIGKSYGAEVHFKVSELNDTIVVFTTRLDTIYGVSYIAIAPEHEILNKITNPEYVSKIEEFRNRIGLLSDIERENVNLKDGIFVGIYAEHPLTKEKVPVYTANFVLPNYGTGAVMAVPAHDQRDFEFAKKYNLPIKVVIAKDKNNIPVSTNLSEAFTEEGILVDSNLYNNLISAEARKTISADLEKVNLGKQKIQYRLRDWLLSRQRYWGTPIPIIYCNTCGTVPVTEENLPVKLPYLTKFSGKENPLLSSNEFLHTSCPKCGKEAKRETDTMDTFVDSSWYYLRYLSPKLDTSAIDSKLQSKFMPVDQYVGGIEHANMHLLYARYFTKVLNKLGYCDVEEPFINLLTQGMVIKDGAKMSKSLGNVVDPDALIAKYGVDTVRLFVFFAAPPEKDLEWSDFGVEGAFRFVKRTYRFVSEMVKVTYLTTSPNIKLNNPSIDDLLTQTHKTIKEFTKDFERQSYNTCVAYLMKLMNLFYALDLKNLEDETNKKVLSFSVTSFLIMLQPFAPHISLELLEQIGMSAETDLKWPTYIEEFTHDSNLTIAIQINGKLRDTITVSVSLNEAMILEEAKKSEKVASQLEGKVIKKSIFVPNKLVNFVVI